MIKRLFKSITFWVVFCIVLGLSGLGVKRILDSKKQAEAMVPASESPLLPVRVKKVQCGVIREWVYGEGTVRAVQRKFLSFGQSGEVGRIGTDVEGNPLREGSRVSGPGANGKAGQLLAQLDQRDILATHSVAKTGLQDAELQATIAEAQVKQAEHDYELAKTDFERLSRLNSSNMISTAEYDAAKNKVSSAETSLTTQRANVQSARLNIENARSRLRQAKLALEQTSLFAPFDGMITRLNIHVGDYVTAHAIDTSTDDAMQQSAAIVVINPNEYEIELHLPAFTAPAVQVGQIVHIRPGSEGFPDEANHPAGASRKSVLQQSQRTTETHPITGTIYSVSPSFSEQGRSFPVKIRTEEGEKYLKDGMFVSCRIIVQEKTDVVLTPSRSLISREGEDFVFVADPESGEVIKRQVRGGIASPIGETEVLSGLQEGELVVINQRDRLTDGSKVKVIR
jgi:RND family efflux transporter MFP subunit